MLFYWNFLIKSKTAAAKRGITTTLHFDLTSTSNLERIAHNVHAFSSHYKSRQFLVYGGFAFVPCVWSEPSQENLEIVINYHKTNFISNSN